MSGERGERAPRAVLRFVDWTLTPDREPDAAPMTFAMRCAVCEAESEAGADFADGHSWALRHAGRNPSHHTYTEVITRPWRCWMSG